VSSAAVERWEPTGVAQVDRAVVWWRKNPQLPASYIARDGSVDLEGMTLGAQALDRIGFDPLANLGDTFVVRDNSGRMSLGFKADLQRTIASRCGYDVMIDEADDAHVVAHMSTPRGNTPKLTKRITDKDIKSYAERNKPNYEQKPRRMLEARISTELVDLYAKGALRGSIAPLMAEAGIAWFEGDGTDVGPGGRLGEVVPPGPALTPGGASIPPGRREPPIADDTRAAILTRITTLKLADPDAHQALVDWWKDQTATETMPAGLNLKLDQVTRLHGWALERRLDDIDNERARSADQETGEIPGAIHDDDPAANGWDPTDPERPFE
jgi:hypothetical protein